MSWLLAGNGASLEPGQSWDEFPRGSFRRCDDERQFFCLREMIYVFRIPRMRASGEATDIQLP